MALATRLLLLAPFLVLIAPSTNAQVPDCASDDRRPAAFLDVNGVQAGLFKQGQLFFSGGDANYEVPQGSGVHSIFAGGIWMGGLVDGDLRTAASTYAQGGEDQEYFPGSLDASGNPPADCTPFDRIWVVSKTDIERYETWGTLADDLRDWPADLGAPFFDVNDDGIYDLEAGDRPAIRGDQMAWWVMNDVAGPHLTTLSEPMGVEVKVSAFAKASPEAALHYTTFYRYEVTYRGTVPMDSTYFTFWTDMDLGNYQDDYVGADTTRDLTFTYNADNDDDVIGGYGYGQAPPAQGVRFLETPGERGLTVFHYYNGSGPRGGNPDTDWDYYNFMRGRWKDGSAMTIGGDGLDPNGEPTTILYPNSGSWDDPIPGYWSEVCPTPDCDEPIAPDDRRYVSSTGPFRMEPGQTQVVTVALVWARGSDNFRSLQAMKVASGYVARVYALGLLDPVAPAEAETPLPSEFSLSALASPNPVASGGGSVIRYRVPTETEVRLALYDMLGREVAVLAEGPRAAGAYEAEVSAEGLPAGVYLYRLDAGRWGSAEGRLTILR